MGQIDRERERERETERERERERETEKERETERQRVRELEKMKEKERERNRERERGNKHHQKWTHSSRAFLVTVYNTRTDEFSKTFCKATAPVWHTGTRYNAGCYDTGTACPAQEV